MSWDLISELHNHWFLWCQHLILFHFFSTLFLLLQMTTPHISLFTLAWCLIVYFSQDGRAAYSRLPAIPVVVSRDLTVPYMEESSKRGSAIPEMLRVQVSVILYFPYFPVFLGMGMSQVTQVWVTKIRVVADSCTLVLATTINAVLTCQNSLDLALILQARRLVSLFPVLLAYLFHIVNRRQERINFLFLHPAGREKHEQFLFSISEGTKNKWTKD